MSEDIDCPGTPDEWMVRSLAGMSGLTPSDDQVRAGAKFYAAMSADLERLRAITLPYAAGAPTPVDVVAWIDRGGRSAGAGDG